MVHLVIANACQALHDWRSPMTVRLYRISDRQCLTGPLDLRSTMPITYHVISGRQCLSGPSWLAIANDCLSSPTGSPIDNARQATPVIGDRQCQSDTTLSTVDNANQIPRDQRSTMPIRYHVINGRQCQSDTTWSTVDNAWKGLKNTGTKNVGTKNTGPKGLYLKSSKNPTFKGHSHEKVR
jgi:hypothetical protein